MCIPQLRGGVSTYIYIYINVRFVRVCLYVYVRRSAILCRLTACLLVITVCSRACLDLFALVCLR